MGHLPRLRDFVVSLTRWVDEAGDDEARLLDAGADLLADLVSHDDWLPESHAAADPDVYQQHLLYRDPRARFSVVSFVWGPGQTTPIHDHTVWGLVGVLRGAEICEEFRLEGDVPIAERRHRLEPGRVDRVSPRIGDVHRVSNALADAPSISIHVYGADIGAVERHAFDPEGGVHRFVSGYSDAVPPDLALPAPAPRESSSVQTTRWPS